MQMLRWFTRPAGKIVAGSMLLTCFFGVSLATAQTCTQLKVTAHPDYPPFAWTSGAGIDGALMRIIERFARQSRIPMTMEPAKNWEEAQRRAAAGEADLIVGLYRTPQREADLMFIDRPMATDPIGVFVRQADADEIDDLSNLKTLRGAAAAGESFGADFDLRIAKQLTLFRTENIGTAVKFLMDKQADYVLSGLYPGLAHLRQIGPGHGIALTHAALIPSQPLHVAFSRKSPCLAMAPALEALIERTTARGDMEGLIAEALIRWTAQQAPK
jgi:polar amino acid transport system substrate-binding protein